MHIKYILTHPIQYQSPLIKYLTKKGIKITVLYRSDFVACWISVCSAGFLIGHIYLIEKCFSQGVIFFLLTCFGFGSFVASFVFLKGMLHVIIGFFGVFDREHASLWGWSILRYLWNISLLSSKIHE